MSYIDRQVELRNRAWEEAKALLDVAAAESRDLTAEEEQKYARINDDLNKRSEVIASLKADEEREVRLAEATRSIADQVRPVHGAAQSEKDAEVIRSLARGEIRTASFIPRTNAYSGSSVFAEGSAIGESDPTFQSFITLNAYKYGFLVQVSREMIEDSGVDLLGFLAREAGISIGVAVNTALTTGTDSTMPNGISVAAGSGITGGTGVSGAFTGDNLIDLSYSVNSAYRRMPGTGWMMSATALAATRKLKDTYGQYLFQPSLQAGQPDQLLGYAIYENPDLATPATSAKSVLFGHLPSYYVRMAGPIRFDRSDEYAFANDLVSFRATVRIDGDLPQTSAVKYFIGGAS